MSSLFDVPVHLAVVLSLAVTGAGSGSGNDPRPIVAQFSSEDPYRFSEQVWLEALSAGAGGEELSTYERVIFRTGSGRYYVPAEAYRAKVLTLRDEPAIAELVAFRSARKNAKLMQPLLKRPVTAGDLYVAHVLGRDAAMALIPAVEDTPGRTVTAVLPQLSALGPAILGRNKRPMTAGAFYRRLTRSFQGAHLQPLHEARVLRGTVRPTIAARGRGAIDLTSQAWLPLKPHLVWVTEVQAAP